MPVFESSWMGVIAMRTLFYIIWRWVCPIWRERSKGQVWLLSSTSYGGLVRRWGQTLLGGTQQKATGTNCRGKFWLQRNTNVHHGDSEALDLLPGKVVGSLLWETLIAHLHSPSAYLLNFAGQLGSKQGMGRRLDWTSPFCSELLCDSVSHVLHIHKIFLQLTQEFTDAPHHQVLQHSCEQGSVGPIPGIP